MTTPLSTAKMRVERKNVTTTNTAHSFISTVLGEDLFIMVLTKKQIRELEKALSRAEKLEIQSQNAAGHIASLIEDFTGVVGYVDHLQGDGFGFTPKTNNDTHIPLSELIGIAKKGVDITEEEIHRRRAI